jgi:hypothetical protein
MMTGRSYEVVRVKWKGLTLTRTSHLKHENKSKEKKLKKKEILGLKGIL